MLCKTAANPALSVSDGLGQKRLTRLQRPDPHRRIVKQMELEAGQQQLAARSLRLGGTYLEYTSMSRENEAGPQNAIQVLLAQLETNRVRYRAVHGSQEHIPALSIMIHPDDMSHFKRVCGTLEQVRLLRNVGGGREFQIVLQHGGEGKSKYLTVRVTPEEYSQSIARGPRVRLPARYHHALLSARTGLNIMFRAIRAWLWPNGLFCVILGPDGVGKSTTIERLQRELETLFGPCRKQRWRPGLIRKVAPDSCNRMPHAKSLRGGFTSVLSLFGMALDFTIGYAVSAHPAMARSEAIIFDRYFHDLLIDPKRYRYAGPMWPARLIARFIPPRRALFIILDAEEQVILSRKQELPIDELRRQRNAYRSFAALARYSMVINTERPVDEIVAEITDNILKVLASRNALNSADDHRAQVNSMRFYH